LFDSNSPALRLKLRNGYCGDCDSQQLSSKEQLFAQVFKTTASSPPRSGPSLPTRRIPMTNVWLPPMNASDVMTKNVISVGPETPTRAVAKLLPDKGISAIPVVDEAGVALGMVSEGDLIRREIK